MKDDRLIQDELVCEQQMAIVERYEDFLKYIYPITQDMDRRHRVVRDKFLEAAVDQVQFFIEAGKSKHVSKLYAADANLGLLRFYLRFMAGDTVRAITPNNNKNASKLLIEPGKMLGSWIKRHGGQRGWTG